MVSFCFLLKNESVILLLFITGGYIYIYIYKRSPFMYIYIYIYVCVCVCVKDSASYYLLDPDYRTHGMLVLFYITVFISTKFRLIPLIKQATSSIKYFTREYQFVAVCVCMIVYSRVSSLLISCSHNFIS